MNFKNNFSPENREKYFMSIFCHVTIKIAINLSMDIMNTVQGIKIKVFTTRKTSHDSLSKLYWFSFFDTKLLLQFPSKRRGFSGCRVSENGKVFIATPKRLKAFWIKKKIRSFSASKFIGSNNRIKVFKLLIGFLRFFEDSFRFSNVRFCALLHLFGFNYSWKLFTLK